jgi:hypothetical protein
VVTARLLFLEKMLELYPKSLGDVPERHDGRISLAELQPAAASRRPGRSMNVRNRSS